jgi:hypothetical protein
MKVVVEAQWQPKLVTALGYQLDHFQWLAELAELPAFDMGYSPGPPRETLPGLVHEAEVMLG